MVDAILLFSPPASKQDGPARFSACLWSLVRVVAIAIRREGGKGGIHDGCAPRDGVGPPPRNNGVFGSEIVCPIWSSDLQIRSKGDAIGIDVGHINDTLYCARMVALMVSTS